ncbi:RICIN domain-containing protein [Streptomyces sp. NPDC004528]|uniref:RICIN domain-containing protein n=1 Tax=Streptomyces sp. NPDC004528 TaxID=3154550 RepID=UPI0033AF0F47
MPTPHPPRPAHPPGGASGECDESLAARLRGRPAGGATRSVALLMARHWQATYDYAVICLASSARVAPMVAATSFHYALDSLTRGESGAALRPRLLVTVRDTVREWAAEDRISSVLPELGKPAGGRGMRVAGSMTAENRRIAERSFHALPGSAQCLLWHTEVEAEPLSVPAGLSGMTLDTATVALEQAREQFRAGCARAHRELAPTPECGLHNRRLDVPARRGGAPSPEERHHRAGCAHCRRAEDHLARCDGALGIVLAEAVLGWGARRYLDTRSGGVRAAVRPPGGPVSKGARGVPGPPDGGGTADRADARGPRGTGGPEDNGAAKGPGGAAEDLGATRRARHGSGGRRRPPAGIPAPGRGVPTGRARSKALLTGAGTVSAVLLVTVLAVGTGSSGGGADPGASTGVGSGRSVPASPGSSPPTASGPPAGVERTRLRNLAADLCLDVRGGRARSGAEAELAGCSPARTQQWSYEDDGLLRSVADPGLCLDSGAADGIVALDRCAGPGDAHGDDVRYDLTVRGELLPRARGRLAVTPGSVDRDSDIVVKDRGGSAAQRWRTEPPPVPRSLSIGGAVSAGDEASEGDEVRTEAEVSTARHL